MLTQSVVSEVVAWLGRHVAACVELTQDSRRVTPGGVFFACVGTYNDGRDYIGRAVAAGAGAIVYEKNSDSSLGDALYDHNLPCLGVVNLNEYLGEIAAAWYGNPAQHLTVVAVTGTNGKTSCTQWLATILNRADQGCGVIGTLGATLPNGEQIETGLTTPDALLLHRILYEMVQQNAKAVAIEASSIGLAEGRLDGLKIDIAAMTNLTRDHLDYHGDMSQYEKDKQRLFEWPTLKAVVNNLDDATSLQFLRLAVERGVTQAYGFTLDALGIGSEVNVECIAAESLHSSMQGMTFTLKVQDLAIQVSTHLLGEHNVANLLLVAGVLRSLGWSWKHIVKELSQAEAARGRLEPVAVTHGAPLVVVDYAHTEDAVARAVQALLPLTQARQGQLICVVGCGGDRDKGKRPLMMRAAYDFADKVIVTSDNPRSERALSIAEDMLAGLSHDEQKTVMVELDRAVAIRSTILSAHANDVILIAGKGHEQYQEIAGQRYPFCDKEQAQAALQQFEVTVPMGLMTLNDAATCMHGVVHDITERTLSTRFSRVSTDSRQINSGELYFALSGDVFDGHDFVEAAANAGAIAAVVERPMSVAIPQIVVPDTRLALGTLAKTWRHDFTIPVVAVVGSNGKTTTKEMISSVLCAAFSENYRLATTGNLNNDIGVPLTLLRMRKAHRAAVIEMGMNHQGEIAYLTDLVSPSVVVMTNAQREHQEFMHTVDAVARENGAALLTLPQDGVAVLPLDDEYASIWLEQLQERRCISFAWSDERADVYVLSAERQGAKTQVVLHTPSGNIDICLSLVGDHHVRNAMAAYCAGLAIGLESAQIVLGLEQFTSVKGRMQWHTNASGVYLIDDTYNANPDSVLAATRVLAGLPGPRLLVLGDMAEVGDQGPSMHEEVALFAKEQGIDYLYAFGEATSRSVSAFGHNAKHFDDMSSLQQHVLACDAKAILVKGSRSMKMERVVEAWLAMDAKTLSQ